MGIFDFLKRQSVTTDVQSQNVEKAEITKQNKQQINQYFHLHPDLEGLIWIGDGKNKNFSLEENRKNNIEIDGIRISVSFTGEQEPSLFFTNQEVVKPTDRSIVPRPPYFPTYTGLSPEQKWVYLDLLSNPYQADVDIGFVFVLYYGLERHLLQGEFERAYNLILKLRDIYKNKSFQRYSADALILTALFHKRGEMIVEFLKSLDKEHEYVFSDNLFLLCYYSFNIPLSAADIMRMAKTFEFTNMNYIKKYPDIFILNVRTTLMETYNDDKIYLEKIITKTELNKLKYENVLIFANTSIRDQNIAVPKISDVFKLKKEMNTILEKAHEKTKEAIAESRKKGIMIEKVVSKKEEKIIQKKSPIAPELLKEPDNNLNFLSKHFHYSNQIQAFYARRNESPEYLDKAIEACNKQISIAREAADDFRRPTVLYQMVPDRTKKPNPEIELPSHLGYRQLCIIREKQGNFTEVIRLAEEAKSIGWNGDWDNRIEKMQIKLGNK